MKHDVNRYVLLFRFPGAFNNKACISSELHREENIIKYKVFSESSRAFDMIRFLNGLLHIVFGFTVTFEVLGTYADP